MAVLNGKNILLGVTGGIAAYKAAFLVRLLVKKGAEVKVVMTDSAKEFVTPLTLATLSKNEVFSSFTNEKEEGSFKEPNWNNHVELALWADLFLIAPATANTLSKMAHGACDNLLLACYLSAKCPVYYAPAMDLDMYQHPTTAETFKKLDSFGNIQIPAAFGELASGLVGQGRMAEPEGIVSFLENDLLQKLPLRGKKFLITAGPTYEAIDPVRFIGNHSSGKMGYAIAETAAELGAEVVLISGPSALKLENDFVKIIRVTSAEEMYNAAHEYFGKSDVAILSAAVADYRPSDVASEKIKKKTDALTLQLTKTKDILASLGEIKKDQFLVGFALETENEEENAKLKLKKKNLDLIVLNSLRDKGAGFQGDTNKITLIAKDNKTLPFPVKPKKEVAKDILEYIIEQTNA
ncbi:bifunctional phosphopantothenoylcysteine decarboxylase/phosphopantothenate--cysteine ligase CoaBC [Aequorivita vladivostokensis]|uniref:Coenzyme A biosynthesis bifunctional protein CoaBC n=1 Tax=Aequorivita vladivostokensis TaxID=171194 RepID=A0ABR5DL96_9FLAO|nr:bifunctional phosphopantothenoylcysteine decarboxylase/phosphopantothenate--cysteine ligase CoaBC [Aequorivita vladivostokensis]KJJ39543.1 phosphopantothenoylcysteine decarboxylase [Aequorivita vladivostokensis]MAB57180.1 bifunctional phosphopantothenoylcysteine decarboxylase/phosphopantothenate--cysteine ligase CoaBC [Aequorivita sp.]MBF31522.1 bifunctional phosphopantothenoylcysteine decarboxylase/phosphopantothenate--cysteine ligase CoaBC [Aequorivita sp.]|tara:strand:- start:2689 stop:3912 length:1224 start_codon:yes stop_codon:yes gene_type:complete